MLLASFRGFSRVLLAVTCGFALTSCLVSVNGGDDECEGDPPPCAAPTEGCNYEGLGCVDGEWTCGTLVCEEDSCEGGPPPCAAPPEGCTYEDNGCVDGQWTCGTLFCQVEPCEGDPPPCAAPPEGCTYEGLGCVDGEWTCGTLVCEEEPCEGDPPPCAAPPEGCNYEGLGCVDGQWTCGTLVCGFPCGESTCTIPIEYCLETFPGDSGTPPSTSCEVAPPACGGVASCVCIDVPGGSCSEVDGAVTVTVALP